MDENKIENVKKAWQTVRTAILLDDRLKFFAGMIMATKLAVSESLDTACVDEYGVVTLNPDVFLGLSREEQKFVACHELSHPAFRYFKRVKGKQYPGIFNTAHDIWINELLKRDRLPMPDWVVTAQKVREAGIPLADDVLGEMTTEQIYDMLVQHAKIIKVAGISNRLSDDAQPSRDGSQSGGGEDGDDQGDRQLVGITEEEVTPINWDALTLQAAFNVGVGYLPGSEQMRLGIKPPKVDWRSALWQFFSEVTEKFKNTFSPPRRRYQWMGVTLPTRKPEVRPLVWFGLDVSGSMQIFMDHLVGEAQACQSQLDCAVRLLAGDTDLTHDQHVEPGDPWPVEISGWGGTYFTWLFKKYFEEDEEDPTSIIFVTDGENFDTIPQEYYPDIATLWVVFNNKDFVPQFGEVIHVAITDL